MKTDMKLKTDIEEELRWDPKVNEAQIGVSVDKGAVSLNGAVDTYAEKWAAEDAVKRVAGVRTIAMDLGVKLSSAHTRTDSDIAAALQSAMKWNVFIPTTVTATVVKGVVTLSGQVHWNFERDAAYHAARNLKGVINVYNSISLRPENPSVEKVNEKVGAALQRQATADAKSIHVETAGGKVTLSGHASSWQSIKDASWAAWAAPGVTEVVDKISVWTAG